MEPGVEAYTNIDVHFEASSSGGSNTTLLFGGNEFGFSTTEVTENSVIISKEAVARSVLSGKGLEASDASSVVFLHILPEPLDTDGGEHYFSIHGLCGLAQPILLK